MVVEATLMFVSVSLKFAFVNGPALMLPRVKVMVLVPPGAMAVGANALMIVGSAGTIRSSLVASALFPPLVVSAPAAIVLIYVPSTLAVTSTVTLQPPAGILVPLASVIVLAPATAVTPLQAPPKLFGVAITIAPGLLGRLSTNALVNVTALAFVLPTTIVNCVLLPATMLATAKLFVIVGGTSGAVTVNVADELTALVLLGAPLLVVSAPAGIVLTYEPAAAAVTLTTIEHVLLAGIVPPVNETEPAPAAAVIVPPHEFDTKGVPEAFTKPAG